MTEFKPIPKSSGGLVSDGSIFFLLYDIHRLIKKTTTTKEIFHRLFS